MRIFVFTALFSLVSGLAFDAPIATPANRAGLGIVEYPAAPTPLTTPAPYYDLRKRGSTDLLRSGYTLVAGFDSTCGFISGNISNSLVCATGNCAYGTSVSGASTGGDVYCGSGSVISGYTRPLPAISCINGTSAVSSCRVDASCSQAVAVNSILICDPNALASNCAYDKIFPFSVDFWRCVTSPIIREGTRYPTESIFVSAAGVNTKAYTTITATASAVGMSTTTLPTSTSSSSQTTSPSSSTSAPSTSNSPSASPVSSSTSTDTTSSGPPLGPIIGGAVGGAAILCIVAAGIFLCVNHRRKKNTSATTGPVILNPPISAGGGANNFTSPLPQKGGLGGSIQYSPVPAYEAFNTIAAHPHPVQQTNYNTTAQQHYSGPPVAQTFNQQPNSPVSHYQSSVIHENNAGAAGASPVSRTGHESVGEMSELHSPVDAHQNMQPQPLQGSHSPPPPNTHEMSGMSTRAGPISDHVNVYEVQ